jgi:hypothetical protein
MIACVIHGAKELKIEIAPSLARTMARCWCGSVPEESADPTCTIIMKAES